MAAPPKFKGPGKGPKSVIKNLTPKLEAAFFNSGWLPASATGRTAPSVTPISAGPDRAGGGFDLTNVQTPASFDQGGGSTVNPLTSSSLDYLKGEDVTAAVKLKQGRAKRKGARSTE